MTTLDHDVRDRPSRRVSRQAGDAVPGPASIGVLLVDDHELVRRGLRTTFEDSEDLRVLGEADGVADAMRALARLRPDVAVVDARLPDGHGLEVVRACTAAGVRSLVLTAIEDDDRARRAVVAAGASAYLVKHIDADALTDSVRRVGRGEDLISELDLPARGEVAESSAASEGLPALGTLTRRQRQVLELVADGLTNREIAERLVLSEKTVKNHVTGLLATLGLPGRTHAATLVARIRAGRIEAGPQDAEGRRPAGAHPPDGSVRSSRRVTSHTTCVPGRPRSSVSAWRVRTTAASSSSASRTASVAST